MLVQKWSKTVGGLLFLVLAPLASAQSPVMILTTSLPSGTTQASYSAQITSNGSPSSTWNANGLPPGVTLTGAAGSTATISGAPTTIGVYSASFHVFDPQTETQATASLSITISSSLAFVTTSPIMPGMVGVNYNLDLSASGGSPPYRFSS